ncbi:MAG: ABC transporter permease [Deltaproteobacteria bacterium]|jgi:putative ABC transport system permease protein|nr:ABC transporter permease [Deltaproteobacteria bacterium]
MKRSVLLRIAVRHLASLPFQTFSVIAVVAFSSGLAVALFLLAQGLRLGVIRAVEPFELIVGARGSPYQLVLNTVFLQDAPVGNLSRDFLERLSQDSRIRLAVPLALGDFYRGLPVIGTAGNILEIRPSPASPLWLRPARGRWWEKDFEAVLGAGAAGESGLEIGDIFRTAHGTSLGAAWGGAQGHERDFRVVGVAEPVHGPYDRAIFVSLESIWEEHAGHAGEVTAILAYPASYTAAYSLDVSLRRDAQGQLIFPAQTAIRLFALLGRGEEFLSVIVFAVAACALLTTLLILYWSAATRGKERALLHALGVPRGDLVFLSWLEGALTLLAGALAGGLLGRAGAFAAFAALGEATAMDSHVPLTPQEGAVPFILLSIGSLGVFLAAMAEKTYDLT